MNPNRELLAGIRILVCVARADGHLSDAEIAALEAAVGDLGGAPGSTVAELLASDINFQAECDLLGSDEVRQQVYEAALVLANADGEATPQEQAMLERLAPPEGESTLLGQVLGETRDTLLPTALATVHDPALREAEIQEDTLKYAVLAAGLGAIPVPGAAVVTDIAVVALQVKLVRDIGCYWGHTLDGKAARTLLASMAGSIGLRIAILNLGRMIPGWGSALGAATSFGTTVAIGRAANAYFASGATLSAAELQRSYEAGVAEGKARFVSEREAVQAARSRNEAAVQALAGQLARGEITQEAYLRGIEDLR